MALSTQSQTGGCLNSTDIAKLFQPQWENTDHVKPVASYSAANLYHPGNVEVASSRSLTGEGGLKDSNPDFGSTLAETEASNDNIDWATTATTVDNDEDDLESIERSSKRARIDGYYPLAMARQQNRAAQLQFRRRKAAPTDSNIENSTYKGSASVQYDHISPLSNANYRSTDRWYYPGAMVQQAQSMYDRPSALSRPSGSNNPQAVPNGTERIPEEISYRPESSTLLLYSQQNNGIHGRFFDGNLQSRPISALWKDQLRSPQALQRNTNSADTASVLLNCGSSRYTERWPFLTSGKAALASDYWHYSQPLSSQSATPLFPNNWWDIPDDQESIMNTHEISDSTSSTAGLSVDLLPSHGRHISGAHGQPSSENTRQPGVYGGPFNSQYEPPGLPIDQNGSGRIYGGFFDYQIQDFQSHKTRLEQQNKQAREKAIVEKQRHDDDELATLVREYAKESGAQEPIVDLKGFYAGFFLSQQQNKKRLIQARREQELVHPVDNRATSPG